MVQQQTELKSIRETFLPDEGCVFLRVDLSQVEDRMGKMYCGTPRMIELANRHPSAYDAHTENARAIFGKLEINKEERYLGKKVVHAIWRKLGGDKMSESVSKDTDGKLFIPPARCNRLIRKAHERMPEIEEVYFPFVEERMIRDEVLVNSWGRLWDISDYRIDADLYRRGYSWYLQSEAADWTNQYGFIPTCHYMMQRYGKPANLQVHDEVAVSVPIEDAWEVAMFIVGAVEQTREIPAGSGNFLTVPAEVTVGSSWYGGVEFKKLPGREEFDRRVREWFDGQH